jgi:hypothetical protein
MTSFSNPALRLAWIDTDDGRVCPGCVRAAEHDDESCQRCGRVAPAFSVADPDAFIAAFADLIEMDDAPPCARCAREWPARAEHLAALDELAAALRAEQARWEWHVTGAGAVICPDCTTPEERRFDEGRCQRCGVGGYDPPDALDWWEDVVAGELLCPACMTLGEFARYAAWFREGAARARSERTPNADAYTDFARHVERRLEQRRKLSTELDGRVGLHA